MVVNSTLVSGLGLMGVGVALIWMNQMGLGTGLVIAGAGILGYHGATTSNTPATKEPAP